MWQCVLIDMYWNWDCSKVYNEVNILKIQISLLSVGLDVGLDVGPQKKLQLFQKSV